MTTQHHQLQLLAQAGADNDALSEEIGAQEVCRRIGIDPDDMAEVAEQRALRAVLVAAGRLDELQALGRGVGFVTIDGEERKMISFLTTVYMDGIALGWRAATQTILRSPRTRR